LVNDGKYLDIKQNEINKKLLTKIFKSESINANGAEWNEFIKIIYNLSAKIYPNCNNNINEM